MKKTMIVMTLMFLLAAAYVYGLPTGATNLDRGDSSSRTDFSGITAATTAAQGGNITALNVAGIRQTTFWQGFYGNISGEIVLDDANNNTFYNWSMTTATGEVYASTDASVTWASIACASQANIASEHTALGMTASDGDNVNNTYTSTDDITVDGNLITSCPSTKTFVSDAPSANFVQVLLYEGSAIVYATILEDGQTGFDGGLYDFQLLVGENPSAGSTTYNFYVELE